MIKVLGNIPKGEFGLACSGGVDSMAIANFLLNGGYHPNIIYFNHNTEHGNKAEEFVRNYCKTHNFKLFVGRTDLNPKSNKEKIWSNFSIF